MNRPRLSSVLFTLVAAFLALAASARAQSLIVATNTLETGAQSYTFGEITNGATYTLSGPGAVLNVGGNFYVGTTTVSGVRNGSLIVTNGAVFNQTGGTFVQTGDSGRKSSVLISGAAFTNTSAMSWAWPENDSGAASLIINGGSSVVLPNMTLYSSNGYFEISGASKVRTGSLTISPSAAAEYTDMVVKDAGTQLFVTNASGIGVGARGSARLAVSGGALITNAGNLSIGGANNAIYPVGSLTGWLYMSSGAVISNGFSKVITFGGINNQNGNGIGMGLLTDPGTILTFVGGNGNISILGSNSTYRSMVVVSNGAFLGAVGTAGISVYAGTLLVVDGGILHSDYSLYTFPVAMGGAIAGLSNLGGVFQFGTANPVIGTSGGPIVVQNGTIGFRGIGNASVTANISGNGLTNLTYLGTNSFQLNNASNTSVAFYNFSASYGATNWAALRLTGATSGWQSTTVHFDTNANLLVTNTFAAIGGVVTNDGAIRVANSYATFQNNVVLNGRGTFGSLASTNNFARGLLIQNGGIFNVQDASLTTGVISNRGGVFQFASATPTFTTNAPNTLILTNGVVSFNQIANAPLLIGGSQLTNITYQGLNSYRLNNASNSYVSSFAFDNLGGSSTNWVGLQMVNGTSAWQSAALGIGSAGSLLVSNTMARLDGVLTNLGAITVAQANVTYSSNVVLLGSSSYTSRSSTNSFSGGLLINAGATFNLDNLSQVLGGVTNNGLVDVLAGSTYRPSTGSFSVGSGAFVVNAGGTLDLSNGSFSAENSVSNSGTIRVINGQVTWNGNMVIGGRYFSDPSTNTFTSNVTVTSSGYLQGSNGDLFVFYRDLINQSTVNTNFSLWQAGVLFTNGAGTSDHTYNVTGSGSANWGTGFTNFDRVSTNFAIGTLSIAPGNRLMITGQVGGGITNAVYVGWLDIQGLGSGSLLTNTFSDVTNTLFLALNLPDINLYYSREDPRNAWLNANIPGTGYNLWSGGLLLPIPEPSAWATIAAGVGLLGLLRGRRKA